MSVKVAFRETAVAATGSLATRSVSLPKAAVQQRDGKDVVLIVQNGRAERRAVTVSSKRDDEVIVSAGVVAGERVVADWPSGLAAGATVREVK
jgi:hypothetical protein